MLDPSDTDAMDKFMSDPQMVKAAEEMMKNMSPETLVRRAAMHAACVSREVLCCFPLRLFAVDPSLGGSQFNH